MLAMGLSMFGVFEIGVKATTMGNDLQHRKGYAGSFWSGALATSSPPHAALRSCARLSARPCSTASGHRALPDHDGGLECPFPTSFWEPFPS
ncbi:MAG: hypothetical protein ACLRPT_01885 [Akkermansia muciniphila]